MRFSVLGSGSKGNCTLIESGSTRVLIDAGFSCKETLARLATLGIGPEGLTAIAVTHEHGDHVRGVGVLARRLRLPVYANAGTLRAFADRAGTLPTCREFGTGEPFVIEGLSLHPFAVSHDTADPVGFVVSDATSSLGYCTDTGRITRLIRHHLQRCGALVLEANHDVQMLRDGPYPLPLKQRVLSSMGHLANAEAVTFAAELTATRLRLLVLAHLSEVNNHPARVLDEVGLHLGDWPEVEVLLAEQHRPSPLLEVP